MTNTRPRGLRIWYRRKGQQGGKKENKCERRERLSKEGKDNKEGKEKISVREGRN
jgi:hypothetical protein